jgi:hypothetical protein
LRQGTKSASEYVEQCNEYNMRCAVKEDEIMILSKFLKYLKNNLLRKVVLEDMLRNSHLGLNLVIVILY